MNKTQGLARDTITSSTRQLTMSIVLLGLIVAATLLMYSMNSAVGNTVRGAWDTPAERTIVIGSGYERQYWLSQNEADRIASELQSQLYLDGVGWSRTIGHDQAVTSAWRAQNPVEIRQVSNGYLRVIGAYQTCEDCDAGATMIERNIMALAFGADISTEHARGETADFLGLGLVVDAPLGATWRDQSLAGAIVVSASVGSRTRLPNDSAPTTFALRFQSRPTPSEIDIARRVVNPNEPESTTIDGVSATPPARSIVANAISSGGRILMVTLAVLGLLTGATLVRLIVGRRTTQFALYRSLGATRRNILRVGTAEAAALGVGSAAVGYLVTQVVLAYGIAGSPRYFVAVSPLVTGAALVVLVLWCAAWGTTGATKALRSQPADILRKAADL